MTKKTFIAIEAVLFIACHNGSKPVRSNDICTYMNLTLRYLEQILQKLVQHNILKGVRGPKGGYLLANDRRKMMLSDIYAATRELENKDNISSSNINTHIISSIENDAVQAFEDYLNTISIADLCTKTKELDILPCGSKSNTDFTI